MSVYAVLKCFNQADEILKELKHEPISIDTDLLNKITAQIYWASRYTLPKDPSALLEESGNFVHNLFQSLSKSEIQEIKLLFNHYYKLNCIIEKDFLSVTTGT